MWANLCRGILTTPNTKTGGKLMSHIVSHVLFRSLYQSLTTTYLTMMKDKAVYNEHETQKRPAKLQAFHQIFYFSF